MTFKLWPALATRRPLSRWAARFRRLQSSRPSVLRLELETLEDRTLPSGVTTNVFDFMIKPSFGPPLIAQMTPSLQNQTRSDSFSFRNSFNETSFLLLPSFSFTFSFTLSQPSTTTTTTTTTSTLTLGVDATIANALIAASTASASASASSSAAAASASIASAASLATSFTSASTIQNPLTTASTASHGNTTTETSQTLAVTSLDVQSLLSGRTQVLSTFIATPQQLSTGVSPSATQQVSLPQSQPLVLPSGGGYGQEDLLPLPVRAVPLTNFDLGVDEGLRGKDATPAPDGMGASILDQLFREWPAPGIQKSDAQPQSENSGSDAAPAAPAVETHSQTSSELPAGAAPAVELRVLKPAAAEETEQVGAALSNDGDWLAAERVEGGASAAALNAEGTDHVAAGLALAVLAYPVGRELRAKQQRRPGLEENR